MVHLMKNSRLIRLVNHRTYQNIYEGAFLQKQLWLKSAIFEEMLYRKMLDLDVLCEHNPKSNNFWNL